MPSRRSIRINARHTSSTVMASTTWRPYRLGSPNSEVTRKKFELAFDTARLGA